MLMNRYFEKPFIKLLECYVLNAIGHLDQTQQEKLKLLEPNLAKTYEMEGSWIEIIEAQMELPSNLQVVIRDVWEDGLETAKSKGLKIDPNEFAIVFVRENFLDV
jgi:hypothetical protein